MPLLRRNKNDEGEEPKTVDDMLDDGDAGSMFMASGEPRPETAGEGEPPAPAPVADESADSDAATDHAADALTPPQEGAGEEDPPEDDETPAAEGEPQQQYEVQTVSGGDGDEALDLFKDVAAGSSLGHLTDDLEEIPIQDLLSELREVRAMLPVVSVDADDPTEA